MAGRAAIYAIANNATGTCYIGESNYLPERVSNHFSALRRSRHHNRALQADWNQYGASAFGLLILERWNFNGPDGGDRARFEQLAQGDREAFWCARARAAGISLYNDQVGRWRKQAA